MDFGAVGRTVGSVTRCVRARDGVDYAIRRHLENRMAVFVRDEDIPRVVRHCEMGFGTPGAAYSFQGQDEGEARLDDTAFYQERSWQRAGWRVSADRRREGTQVGDGGFC